MEDNRNHDHYVFQDLDLLGNKIKNVSSIENGSADVEISKADINGTLNVDGATTLNYGVTVTGNSSVSGNSTVGGTLEVTGKSTLKDLQAGGSSNSISITGLKGLSIESGDNTEGSESSISSNNLTATSKLTIEPVEIVWENNSLVFRKKASNSNG